jgi:uncharacterized protein (TIGR03118 family)
MKRTLPQLALAFTLVLCALGTRAGNTGTTNNYKQTNLVADTAAAGAAHVDPNLINPWGIAFLPGAPFWVSDNNSGVSTLYDAAGNINSLVVTIPPPAGNSALPTPTGIVVNLGPGFAVGGRTSLFIFATEDGTISAWNGLGTNAILAVDNSAGGGAVYKGLTQVQNAFGTFLLAANFRSGKIDIFDGSFQPASFGPGAFSDPNIPAGFAPFGIHNLDVLDMGNDVVAVTYALQDPNKHDPISAPGNGFVDFFDDEGNMLRRVVSNGELNSPWGVAMAPGGFGAFGGKLLVGNFGDGLINAFDPNTGAFLDSLRDPNGNVISNPSMWDMVFGTGGINGDPNSMFFTAGGVQEMHGLFASLAETQPAPTPSPDFSVSASPQTMTVTAGQSAMFSIKVSPVAGFNSAVSLSCSGLPMGTSCMFNPGKVMPNGSAASSTLTVSTTAMMRSEPVPFGQNPMRSTWPVAAVAAVAAGLAGLLLVVLRAMQKRARLRAGKLISATGMALIFVALLAAVGCSSSGKMNQNQGTPHGTMTIMVVASSGSVTHSTAIALTVR